MQDEITAIQKVLNTLVDFFVNYSFQVVGAILVLIVGLIVARSLASFLMKLFERKHFDITLAKFAAATVKGIIIGFAIIVALGKFGITIAPFIAALAAVAFRGKLCDPRPSFKLRGRSGDHPGATLCGRQHHQSW